MHSDTASRVFADIQKKIGLAGVELSSLRRLLTSQESRRDILTRKARKVRERAAEFRDPLLKEYLENMAKRYEVVAGKEAKDESDETSGPVVKDMR
ncbi:MAG: hypothetical protein WBX25_32720 [Rhodomicrobium sp.]